MKKLMECLFPKYTGWIDIETVDKSGYYKLIQMKIRVRDNKKIFRIRSMGFINNSHMLGRIRENIAKYNC